MTPPRATPPPARSAPPELPPAVAQAVQRLQASRLRLQAQWLPEAASHPATGAGPATRLLDSLSGWWQRITRQGASLPLVMVGGELLGDWWRGHPWRATAETLTQAVAPHAARMVRRHPLATVAVAAGAGVLIVALRPWRTPWLRQQLQGVPAQVGRSLWRLAAEVPLHQVVASVLGATAAATAQASHASHTPTAAQAEPPAFQPTPETSHAR